MRRLIRNSSLRALAPALALFIFVACAEDDGPVNAPIEGEEPPENYMPGDPGVSGIGNSKPNSGNSSFGASSGDRDGDGILDDADTDIGGEACASDTNPISSTRSVSCTLVPASLGMGEVDVEKVGVQVEKKDSDSGRVLTLATEDLPCGEGGEYEVSDSGAVTICSETCSAIKEAEDYDAISAFLGCE